MAGNPNPTHISDEMWWFIEELERIGGADTEYAGSWGDFKPGYHCDAYTLWWHKVSGKYVWRNDYSTALPADKVLGNKDLEHLGAAVDWTFRSAQNGDRTNILLYGSRVRAAWAARDPRLNGWREVLCQGDADASADGYDFVSWTERTPDATHKWHIHFSVLRKYIKDLAVYEAMISILRGETLEQWNNRGDDMPEIWLRGEKGEITVMVANTCRPIKDMAGLAKNLNVRGIKGLPTWVPVAQADVLAGVYGELVGVPAKPLRLDDAQLEAFVSRLTAIIEEKGADVVAAMSDASLNTHLTAK